MDDTNGATTDGRQDCDCDVLFIGAGPVGLFGAYYSGLRGLSVMLMDALPAPGGQISAMYPEKEILDVAGYPRVRGRDLVDALVEQADPFKPEYLLEQQAVGLATVADGVVVTTADGTAVRARAVVLTGGIGSFSPKPLPAAAGWTGGGVLHFVERPAELTGCDVVIVGGGDSAIDWALMLAPLARSLTVVHRRDRFRAHAAMVQRVRDLGVPFLVPGEVTKLLAGDDGRLASVEVSNRQSQDVTTLPAQAVIAALGFHAELGPLADWGLPVKGRHIVVDSTGATGVPRVYAAGDLVTYPGKVALLATGFGEVATAVNNLAAELDPSVSLFPGHTSEMS
jgi:thioredoxin reductase (NADPH)